MRRAQVWRAGEAPVGAHLPTGFPALDTLLGARGWPCPGLVEILTEHHGIGALRLLLPALAALSQRRRWLVWVSPPHIPYAPALVGQGVATERVLIVDSEEASGPQGSPARMNEQRTKARLWTFEQALRFPDCGASLVWLKAVEPLTLRRLKLACEAGGALGVMFRPLPFAEQASPAAVRLALAPGQTPETLAVRILKGGRGHRLQQCQIAL